MRILLQCTIETLRRVSLLSSLRDRGAGRRHAPRRTRALGHPRLRRERRALARALRRTSGGDVKAEIANATLPSAAIATIAEMTTPALLILGSASLVASVLALAKLARLFDIPAVVTTAPSEGGAPRVTPEIAAALGEPPHHQRTTTDAFTHDETRDAIPRTGRRTLLIAGIATEIVVQHTSLSGAQRPVDAGPLRAARFIELAMMLLVHLAYREKLGQVGLQLLRSPLAPVLSSMVDL